MSQQAIFCRNAWFCITTSKIDTRSLGAAIGHKRHPVDEALITEAMPERYWQGIADYLNEDLEDLLDENFLQRMINVRQEGLKNGW